MNGCGLVQRIIRIHSHLHNCKPLGMGGRLAIMEGLHLRERGNIEKNSSQDLIVAVNYGGFAIIELAIMEVRVYTLI